MGNSIAVDLRSAGMKAMQSVAPRPWAINTRFETKLNEKQAFDAQAFLNSAGVPKEVVKYGSKETIFTQGDPATSVLYIQEGGVKLAVVNEVGNEAIVAILGPGDFVGEECVAGQSICTATATTIAPTTALIIGKHTMIRVLHGQSQFSDRFIAYLIARNIRVEEDLIDQLFNSSEKRLARTLLRLARHGKQDKREKMIAGFSQDILAKMIGTTRSRVNYFLNKFRKLGFIEYGGRMRGLQINESLQSIVMKN
jgi:CRP/FNR family cyclic AMP-dependent transcriptional regulator